MQKIFLYGSPGSGKTTVGKVLAQNLNRPFIDLDAEIESRFGQSISPWMDSHGEQAFREVEAQALNELCLSEAGIISLGGGTLLREQCRKTVDAHGTVILLTAEVETLSARLGKEEGKRPLLAGNLDEKLNSLLAQRADHYDSFPLQMDTNSREPQSIAWEIQRRIGQYHVHGMGAGYDVLAQAGSLAQLGGHLNQLGLQGDAFIVSDENIAPHYMGQALRSLQDAGIKAQALVIPAGEEHKTLDTVAILWRGFLEAGLDRQSTVIALGGGVVGDLTGFAAATFMRGCHWVAVPTTLLAMADASLGGKTGFDLPEGKNLIGSFYPPRLVLADPLTLSTLPERELRSGLAEVVKHGIIADLDLFDLCERGFDQVKSDLPAIVRRAMGVKVHIIEQDPLEQGIRATLNFGHTVGHAVEIVSRFELRHGEAVSIGMVAEARLAERLGLTEPGAGLSERIRSTLAGFSLPVEIPSNLPRADIIQAMKTDKKKQQRVVRFALPVHIGEVRPGITVENLEAVL